MLVRGDIEAVNLSNGKRHRRVSGNGVSYLESCPVCGSVAHIHCSHGCEGCDAPNNPHPRFAESRCQNCRKLLCWACFENEDCTHICDVEPPHRTGCICADCSGAELTSDND